MTLGLERRCYTRILVEWPVVFYTRDFFGHGTVIDVSPLAWRLRASLAIPVGMQLGVRVWPAQSTHLEIEEAIVLWANGRDFAIEINEVRPEYELAMCKLQEQTIGLCPEVLSRKAGITQEPIAVYPDERTHPEYILHGRIGWSG